MVASMTPPVDLRFEVCGRLLVLIFLLFNYRIHIYIESARDSFYCLPRITFCPAKHDINNLQTKDTDAKVGSSTQQVYAHRKGLVLKLH